MRSANARIASCRFSTPKSGHSTGLTHSVSASRKVNANTYTAGASNPFGAVGSTDSEQMSLYAVYAPS